MQLVCSLPDRLQKAALISINVVFLILSVIYNQHEASPYFQFNSIVNVLLAFPFFTIGFILKPLKERMCTSSVNVKATVCFLVSLIIIFICGKLNNLVYLYMCSYGDSLPLCFLGGALSVFFLLIFKKFIGGNTIIDTLGQGTIIILGLHVMVMTWLMDLRSVVWCSESGFELYLVALLTLLAFVPINILFKRYLPILYGRLRLQS